MKLARLKEGPEVFHSLQGEGPSMGRPSAFVRLSRCNLYCEWCDTDYTWNFVGTSFVHRRDGEEGFSKHERERETVHLDPEEVAGLVAALPARNVVLTGGEPLLQAAELLELIANLRGRAADYRFELETNATLMPPPALFEALDQINASPKLESAGVPVELRERPDVLAALAQSPKAIFKLVVADERDLSQALALVERHALPRARVYLCPEGTTSAELIRRRAWLAPRCLEHGLALTDRLHVHLFGGGRGV